MLENWQQWFMIFLVIAVFISFAKEWISTELVAITALITCIWAGLLSMDSSASNYALKVFGHSAPITVACMFILSASLEKTGIIDRLGDWFETMAGDTPLRAFLAMMTLVIFPSALVNNTPVVVVFMPIVLRLCRKRSYKASRFLIPLSYAAIVGGTLTIVGTSTNLVAAEIAQEKGINDFSMFSITPLGIVFVAITFIYLLTVGRKLLPDRVTLAALIDSDQSREFITHAIIPESSSLDGKHYHDTSLSNAKKVRIIQIIRNGATLRTPLKDVFFRAGDEIVLRGQIEGVAELSTSGEVQMAGEHDPFDLVGVRKETAILMEGIIGPNSTLAGRTLADINFRRKYGVIILAVHRQGVNMKDSFDKVKLAFGDTILVQGPRENMDKMFEERDFVNLTESHTETVRPEKAGFSIAGLLLFMALSTLGEFGVIPKIPVVVLAMTGAMITLLSGAITPKEAYQAIDWRVIFMIFGMLGVGMALEASGLASNLAGAAVSLIGNNPHLLLAAIYLLAAFLTEIISNNAVAALLTPLSILVATEMGVSPVPFIVAVMFGSSASFSTPIGYQTNTFVYGAGGYKFGDFFKVGFPLAITLWIVASLIIPMIWKF